MVVRFQNAFIVAVIAALAALSADRSFATTAGYADVLDGDGLYSNAGINVTPFFGNGSSGLFGVNGSCCMGVQTGTNNVAVDDGDGLQGGADAERLEFQLDAGFGLVGIDFIFARANPILLSGFLTDPQIAVGFNPNGNITAAYDDATKSVRITHPWAGGSVTDFTFGNPGASSGQKITLSVFDPAQAAPQAAVYGFEWDVASPTFSGDVDGDGDVDLVETTGDLISDFDVIRANWFSNSSPTRAMGDLNGDGIVEFDDFAEWKAAFPFPIAGNFETGFYVVPEPAGLASVSIALLGLSLRRRQRIETL
jgi:hypothetical protein